MNRQISELTNLVLALTEKISSSNREGNELNTVSNSHEARSDTTTLFYHVYHEDFEVRTNELKLIIGVHCLGKNPDKNL